MSGDQNVGNLVVDNEELTKFVSSTLAAICSGITEASNLKKIIEEYGHSTFHIPEKIEFDIAVSAKHTSEGSKGLKLEVFKVGANFGTSSGNQNTTVSRIRFDVPWHFTPTREISIGATDRYDELP